MVVGETRRFHSSTLRTNNLPRAPQVAQACPRDAMPDTATIPSAEAPGYYQVPSGAAATAIVWPGVLPEAQRPSHSGS